MKVSHQDLFPTRLWSAHCHELQPHHAAWLDHLNALRSATPKPAGRSNRGGWNSGVTLFQTPAFAPLRTAVTDMVRHAMMQCGQKGSWQVSLSAWANMHDAGGYNTLHMHPGHLLSGVYYLKVPPQAGAIVFRDPKYAAIMTGISGDQPFSRNFESVVPVEGQMLLFPSWLEHRVEENLSDQERVSIAFNVKVMGLKVED